MGTFAFYICYYQNLLREAIKTERFVKSSNFSAIPPIEPKSVGCFTALQFTLLSYYLKFVKILLSSPVSKRQLFS